MLTDDPKRLRDSTVCGELAGDAGVTKWSPEQRRRQALAAVGFGHQRSGRYGVQTRKRRGGGGAAAHSGCSRRRSRLGEAREAANRRRRSPVTDEGNDSSGGVAAHPRPRGLSRRSREMLRSSWARWGDTGTTVATTTTARRRRLRRPWLQESEGERQGANEMSTGSGCRRGACPGVLASRAASS